MTDKQSFEKDINVPSKEIIVDGVDVSGCKYYLFREQQPNGERCCGVGLVDCNGNDCLYKKYKRKEQECKNNKIAYQMELDIYNQECLNLQEELKAKELECERLNSALGYRRAGKKTFIDLSVELDQLKAENETYKKMLDNSEVRVALIDVKTGERKLWRELGMKAEKLKQTLTEIKGFAENFCNESCPFKDDEDDDICVEDCLLDEIVNPILQKISEVKDE